LAFGQLFKDDSVSHNSYVPRVLMLITLLALAIFVNSCATNDALLPEFELDLYDVQTGDHTRTLSTRDLKDQIVVLNFWATWCAPCRAEMPDLDRVHSDFERLGIKGTVIGLDQAIDPDPPDQNTVDFLVDVAVSYPVGVVTESDLAAELQVTGLPTTFLVDQKRRITKRWVGIVTRDQVIAEVEELSSR